MIGLPNPWVIVGAGVAAIGLAIGGYYFGRSTRGASCDRDAARVEVKAQKDVLDWLQDARAQEIASQAAVGRIAEAYERGKTDAQSKADAVVADLRTGTLRLRDRWQGCQADLSKASATASVLDAAERSRQESAGRAIGAAELCDAQVRGLQDYARQVSQ